MNNIRNIGIIAHIDAGKTTTTERILFYTGKTHSMGEVDYGNTTMDWMSQEQDRGITITSAAISCNWKETQINIIDTPGHVDFTAEVERSLRVLDSAIVVFCGTSGVQPQTETVWRQSEKYKIPKIAYINKMDRRGADYKRVLKEIEDKFNVMTLPINIPIGSEGEFRGILDLLNEKEVYFLDKDDGKTLIIEDIKKERMEEFQNAKEELIDVLSMISNELAQEYLDNGKVRLKLIKEVLKRGCLEKKILITLCGSSLKNIGIQLLLDAVIDYLPKPDEIGDIVAINPKNGNLDILFKRNLSESPLGLIFKIQNDKEMGPLSFLRVYSGKFEVGKQYYNVNKGTKERINKLLRVSSNKFEGIQEVCSGDIAAVVGLKFSFTGETLTSEGRKALLEKIDFPEPVISLSLEPETLSDRDKLKEALNFFEKEDPTFKHKEEDSGEIVISGMGELHLEVLASRIKEEWKINLKVGNPHVNYKEGIEGSADIEEEFRKNIGGKEHFVKMRLRVEPNKKGNLFENKVEKKIKSPLISFIKEVAKGCFDSGIKLGYPIADVKFSLEEIEFDENLSSELAISSCLSMGFHKACEMAMPVIMEPYMEIEITSPKDYIGDITNSIIMRGGLIECINSENDFVDVLKAKSALESMFGYSTILRSITKGKASYTMNFSHYETKRK